MKPYKTLNGEKAKEFVTRWPNFAPWEVSENGAYTVKLYAYSEEERKEINKRLALLG